MYIRSLDEIVEKAKQKNDQKKLAIAAAEDEYVIKAALKARDMKLISPVFVGDRKKIKQLGSTTDQKIDDNEIFHVPDKDIAVQEAVKLVKKGEAHLLMKGLVPTSVLLRKVLSKDIGLSERNILNHLALFEIPAYHKILGITDAAMNISPGLNEKIMIIHNSVMALHKLGIKKPKIALLSAIEKVNIKIPSSTEAALLTMMNRRGQIDDCLLDGPLALDAAISIESASHKCIDSPVAGDADLLVVPEINSGNILYKSLTYLANAKTASVILGAAAPIILTSRSDSEESKLYSIALAICLG